ncbi:MAG: hypothetical protein J6W18_04200 [Bacteroidaceae bacterium]|nr:hypothetical protein [Bacteroidaceae bacterium]
MEKKMWMILLLSTTIIIAKSQPIEDKYVDLGLSVKWATYNIGATNPEDSGYYFAWGEVSNKSDYSWSTYVFCSDCRGKAFTKYVLKKRQGNLDKKQILDLDDDAAHVIWGSKWRIPTINEMTELQQNCRFIIEEKNGVNGFRIYSKVNNNSIFLPFAGSYGEDGIKHKGNEGAYWTSNLTPHGSCFYNGSSRSIMYLLLPHAPGQGTAPRFLGLPIRPVWDSSMSED